MAGPKDFTMYQVVFDRLPVPFMVAEITVDGAGEATDMTYRYLNEAFANLTGRTVTELLEQSHRHVFRQPWAWLQTAARPALTGLANSFTELDKRTGRYLHVDCFQISPGLCGCLVTDISADGDARQRLQVEHESFEAALESTGLHHWEYDVRHDRSYQSSSSQRELGVPPVMENYPQSFLDSNMILPKYWNQYLEIHKKIQAGAPEATGEYEIWPPRDEFPHWERLVYKTVFDEEGHPVKAIGTALDVSDRKRLEARFEEFLTYHRRLLHSMTDAFRLNITKDTIIPLKDKMGFFQSYGHLSMNRFFELSVMHIEEPSSQSRYKKIFSREKLLAAYSKGIKTESFECLYHLPKGARKWLRFVINMTQDPSSNNIIGITYTEDWTEQKLTQKALSLLLGRDYETILVADSETDTYAVFVYDGARQEQILRGSGVLSYLGLAPSQGGLTLGLIRRRLQEQGSFEGSYEIEKAGSKQVKRLQFHKLDAAASQLCIACSALRENK